MPLNTEMLIDLALNVAGYVAAGALSLVIYSMFHRSPRVAAPRSEAVAQSPAKPQFASAPVGAQDVRGMQFVGFGESPRTESGAQSLTLRRNRTEVLRIARTMLQSGATDDEIKASLPVSDAELALMTYERK